MSDRGLQAFCALPTCLTQLCTACLSTLTHYNQKTWFMWLNSFYRNPVSPTELAFQANMVMSKVGSSKGTPQSAKGSLEHASGIPNTWDRSRQIWVIMLQANTYCTMQFIIQVSCVKNLYIQVWLISLRYILWSYLNFSPSKYLKFLFNFKHKMLEAWETVG